MLLGNRKSLMLKAVKAQESDTTVIRRITTAGYKIVFILLCITLIGTDTSAQSKHIFSLSKTDFLLDGKPFQIISGEMHPARIPREYWRQRIQMAKAMGCNTIAAYIFWNYHETREGQFDFKTGNRDIATFIKICQEEKMWVLLRPGPYVCAEWDLGGLPPYLLKYPDIKLRCMDPRYMEAAERYVNKLAKEVVSLQCINGGPILMVQVENEYGSYGNDKNYLEMLRKFCYYTAPRRRLTHRPACIRPQSQQASVRLYGYRRPSRRATSYPCFIRRIAHHAIHRIGVIAAHSELVAVGSPDNYRIFDQKSLDSCSREQTFEPLQYSTRRRNFMTRIAQNIFYRNDSPEQSPHFFGVVAHFFIQFDGTFYGFIGIHLDIGIEVLGFFNAV